MVEEDGSVTLASLRLARNAARKPSARGGASTRRSSGSSSRATTSGGAKARAWPGVRVPCEMTAGSRERRSAGTPDAVLVMRLPIASSPLRGAVAAMAAGRAAGDVLAFVGATVIVAETAALAEAKLADYRRYASPEAALVHASASMGIDLERFGMDEPIGGESNAITSNLAAMAQQGMTKRKLLERMVLGSRQAPIVGDPVQVADALMAWVEEADVDGFILSRTVTPECFEDFVELVVPELQRRGVYKERYAPGTLREKLFGGGRLLGPGHPGAGYRAV